MVQVITIIELSMAAVGLFLLVILSSSFFGAYISEISLWFSWAPITNIIIAITYIVRFAQKPQPNIDLILLIICSIAFLAIFLRIIIPFLQVKQMADHFVPAKTIP